jgi:hypothetical protein
LDSIFIEDPNPNPIHPEEARVAGKLHDFPPPQDESMSSEWTDGNDLRCGTVDQHLPGYGDESAVFGTGELLSGFAVSDNWLCDSQLLSGGAGVDDRMPELSHCLSRSEGKLDCQVCKRELTDSYCSEPELNTTVTEYLSSSNHIHHEEPRQVDWITHGFPPPQDESMLSEEADRSPGWVPTLDQMLQDEDNDTDRGFIGDEVAVIANVEENESTPPPGESSQPPSLHSMSEAAGCGGKQQPLAQPSRVAAHPGRVFPNYCPLCNISFMARNIFLLSFCILRLFVVSL